MSTDYTPIGPVPSGIANGTVDATSKQLARDMRGKAYGKDVRETIARMTEWHSIRTSASEVLAAQSAASAKASETSAKNSAQEVTQNAQNAIKLFNDSIRQQSQKIDNMVVDFTDYDFDSAPEIVAARRGKPSLGAKIDEVDAQLAQTANELDNFKIDKGNVLLSDLNKDSIAFDSTWFTSDFLSELNNGEINTTNLLPETVSSEHLVNKGVPFSKLENDIVDPVIFNKLMLSDEYINLTNSGTYVSNQRLDRLADGLEYAEGINTTDYIKVKAGTKLIFERNGVDIFSFTEGLSGNNRMAWYDTNKNWIGAGMFVSLDDFIAENDGYIRVSYERNQRNYITTTSHKKLKPEMVAGEQLNQYLGTEPITSYNPNGNIYGKGFSGNTNTLVDSFDLFITDYLFLPKNTKPTITINGQSIEELSQLVEYASKIIVYNRDKEWLSTNYLTSDFQIMFDEDVFFRLQLDRRYYEINSIEIPGFRKIRKEFIESSEPNFNPLDPSNENLVDVFLFMGQSNMAGRGIQTEEHPETAPIVSDIAYEYRAITAPNQLTPLTEPFGVNEINTKGIYETSKTGSMVSSFAKKYHEITGKKLIGISASKGGSAISQWLPGTPYLNDTISRVQSFNNFANENNIKINGMYIVWNQGESDNESSETYYRDSMLAMLDELRPLGVSKLFNVRVGHRRDDRTTQKQIMDIQTQITKDTKDIIMVGNLFGELSQTGYLKDDVHFVQQGYNLQGEQAGINTAYYLTTGKEPTMYDPEYDNLYYSHKH